MNAFVSKRTSDLKDQMRVVKKKAVNQPSKNLSKSIIVHHNRNANVIQSLGRYNDVLSADNFEYQLGDKE